MSRYIALLEQRAALDREIEAARAEEAAEAAKTCRELIERFDLTPHDVGFVKTQHVAAKKTAKGDRTFHPKPLRPIVAPIYRDPETGNTWSGRGKEPGWLKGHRDEYLIANSK